MIRRPDFALHCDVGVCGEVDFAWVREAVEVVLQAMRMVVAQRVKLLLCFVIFLSVFLSDAHFSRRVAVSKADRGDPVLLPLSDGFLQD